MGRNQSPTWDAYGPFLGEALCRVNHDRYSKWSDAYTQFATTGMVLGDIPNDLAEALCVALQDCSVEPWRPHTVHPQYAPTIHETDPSKDFTDTVFYEFSEKAQWRLADIYDHLRDHIAACLGSPWRVLDSRGWTLKQTSADSGPNAWHMDGLPLIIYKIMLYLTPIDEDYGTLQVKTPDGKEITLERESPTWVLFKPSELLHRGIPPQAPNAARHTIEVKVIPGVTFDLAPFSAGQNARHPYRPWFRAWSGGI